MAGEGYDSVLIFGAPGVGKGTQGRILGQIPGFFHFACGDVFRALDMSSAEGKEVYAYSSKGELVPDDLTIRIWEKGLNGHIAVSAFRPKQDILVLDGIPRNVLQAKMLESYVSVQRIIHLTCSDEEAMIDRIKRRAISENRPDDANEQVIRHRFEVYREESAPVLDHYPQEIIFQVDSIGTPVEILRKVLDCLIPVQKNPMAD